MDQLFCTMIIGKGAFTIGGKATGYSAEPSYVQISVGRRQQTTASDVYDGSQYRHACYYQ